jgi:hypothetical protein
MSGAINQLIVDSVRAGTQIPAALQPIIERMIRMGLVTDAAARAMLGLEADTMPALADIKAAADRYGLTLDQLGDKVQQLEMTETARQIIKDFDLLTLAGADAAVLLEGQMGDALQGLVIEAMTTGRELPEALRPILETMRTLGLLTDENGVKLENLDRISFGRDLTQAIDALILKLTELIDAFSTVGTTAEDAWRRAAPPGAVFTGVAVPKGGGGAPSEPTAPGAPPPGSELPPPSERSPSEPPPGARPSPGGTISGSSGDVSGGGDLDREAIQGAHTGGYLWAGQVYPYAGSYHTGGLTPDEFFIKAQSGEFMQPRTAVRRYGLDFMRDVQQGSYQPQATRPVIQVSIDSPITMDGYKVAELVAKKTLQ